MRYLEPTLIQRKLIRRTGIKPDGRASLRTTRKKKGFIHELVHNRVMFLMLLPTLIFFLVNSYFPMVGIYYAFTQFDFNTSMFNSKFVGLQNFEFLWRSGTLLKLTMNTIGYNIAFIVLGNVLAIVCAILLSELNGKWFKKISQSVMFLPYFVSFVILSVIVYNLFNYDSGFLNTMLTQFGLDPVDVYSKPWAWIFLIIVFYLWKNLGYSMVIYLAAITGISDEYYEAATIDGANIFQRIWYITVPMLKSTFVVLLLFALGSIMKGQFDLFGLPQLGLGGIAISNIISRLIGVIVLYTLFRRSFEIKVRLRDFRIFNGKLFKEILRIAWPLGINSSCWVFSQLIVYSFLAALGAEALAARTYLNTLESFCFTLGYAIALAGQIQIAHLFGAGKLKEAYQSAYRTLFIGLTIVSGNMLLLFLFGRNLLGYFTSDPRIITLGVSLLALNLLLQPCKMLNMAMGNSLNAIGDTRYTMYISIVSMSLIGVGCSYWFGIGVGWGLTGIYCCMIADEFVRGLLVLIRWRGRKVLRQADTGRSEENSFLHREDKKRAITL